MLSLLEDIADPHPGPDEVMEKRDFQDKLLMKVFKSNWLEEREKIVLEEIFINEQTEEEVGKKLGISQPWVSRICSKALWTIREKCKQEGFDE